MTPSLTPGLRTHEELQVPEPEPASMGGIAPANVMPPTAWKSAWSTFADGDRLPREGRGDARSSAAAPRRPSARRDIASSTNFGHGAAARPAAQPTVRALPAFPLPKAIAPGELDTGLEPPADSIGVPLGSGFDGIARGGPLIAAPPSAAAPASLRLPPNGSTVVYRTRRGTSWPIDRRVDTVLGEVAGQETVTLRSDGPVSAIESTSDARQRTGSAFPRQALAVLVLLIIGLSLAMLPLNRADDANAKAPRQRTEKSR